jgi:prepilin-type processing-associated H-X9-DG protein
MWDLIVILSIVAFLGLWFSFTRSGERGRTVRCANNLRMLGPAMQSYVNDHNDGLPAAGINLGNTRLTWDLDSAQYLQPTPTRAISVYDKKQLLLAASQELCCPSDLIQRTNGVPRSYAMAACVMTGMTWPLGSASPTGVGLWWDKFTVAAMLGDTTLKAATKKPESLPRFKVSDVPRPADTLLMTELFTSDNTLGSLSHTRVWNVNDQENVFKGDSSAVHGGRFNYLMVDGHVELLTGLQTGGIGNELAGIWTIEPGD